MPSFSRPSPAMIVALIALVFAVTGGAYALTLERNSVRSKQIARNAVKSPEIARNAARGIDVNEATFGVVPNADKLDGHDSTALVRSFAGHIGNDQPDEVFNIPELEVRILGDDSMASSSNWRVHNDSDTGTVAVHDPNNHLPDDVVLTVGPNITSGGHGGSTILAPLVLTTTAHPDLMLLFACAMGANSDAYCFGHLMRAPAR